MTMIDDSLERAAEIRKLSIIPELISHHLCIRGDDPALSEFDTQKQEWVTLSFKEVWDHAQQWHKAITASGLKKGDKAAMLLPNSIAAVCFDQGALIGGRVPVPLHIIDTAANCAYIINDSETKLLVVLNRARWHAIEQSGIDLPQLKTVVFIDDEGEGLSSSGVETLGLDEWLARGKNCTQTFESPTEEDLAALVYTSGTTGKPKGVMLTHKNIMSDISALLYNLSPMGGDEWLSFLPLSHTFERTTSYYIGLGMGNNVTFSRGVTRILDDLKHTRPTIMMSVPRVYEKVAAKIKERLKTKGAAAQFVFNSAVNAGYRRFERRNGLAAHNPFINALDDLLDPFYNKTVRNQIKNSFGGRLRVAVSGGAALSTDVARTLIGLGVEIYQGYGMTETSPIISVNKIGANHPDTVGPILPGIEAKIGDKDELLVRGPQVMKGYWKRPEDTAKTINPEGWLSTGDQAEIGEGRYLKIKGRIKEIIVTSTGEKVPPVDIEQVIESDPLFDQAMIYGDNRPFICALLVVNKEQFADFVTKLSLDPNDPAILTNSTVIRAVLKRLKNDCRQFPQYGVPRAVKLLTQPWTVDNGALTPTLKIKRRVIVADHLTDIDNLYKCFGK